MINVHVCTSPIANGVFGNAEAALPIANGLAGSTGQPLPIANGPLIGPFQSQTGL
jgi:hypothetical protein